MKKIILVLSLCIFSFGLDAQNNKFYFDNVYCGYDLSTHCCCYDEQGNYLLCVQCWLPAYRIECISGGIFECESGLSGCDGNPSNCVQCCPSNGHAGGGDGTHLGIYETGIP